MKKIFLLLPATIVVVTAAGCTQTPTNTQQGNIAPAANQQQAAPAPTLEEVVQKINVADDANNGAAAWEFMHPDDKVRWQGSDEYAKEFALRHADSGTVTTVKEIKDIASWTHPITGKVYANIKAVVRTVALKSQDASTAEPTESWTFWQKVGDSWYFFSSSILSTSDRTSILNDAKPGPAYSAFVKGSNTFNGQRVQYTGQVLQINQVANGTGYIRFSVTQDASGSWDSKAVVWVHYTRPTTVLKNDIVTVYGILSGFYTYVSKENNTITDPYLEAAAISKK